MATSSEQHKNLYKLLASIKSDKEAKELLIDLLAPHEIDFIAERWAIMQEVDKGCSQRDIARRLGTSIAKVSRCARTVKYGKGIKSFLKKNS